MTVNQNEMKEKRDFIGIDWITLRVPIQEVKISKNYKDQLNPDSDRIIIFKDEEYLYIKFKMNSFAIPYWMAGGENEFEEDYLDDLIKHQIKKSGVRLKDHICSLEVAQVGLLKKVYLKNDFRDYQHLLNLLKMPGFKKSYLKTKYTYRFENSNCKIELTNSDVEREVGFSELLDDEFDHDYEENALMIWLELKKVETIRQLFDEFDEVGFYKFDKTAVTNIFNNYLEEFLPSIEKYNPDYSASIFLETNLNLIKVYRYPVFNEHLERAKNLINLVDDVTPYAKEGKYEGSVISAFVEMIERFQEVISVPHSYGLEDYQSKQKIGDWVLDDRLEKLKELKSKLMEPAKEISLFAHPLI